MSSSLMSLKGAIDWLCDHDAIATFRRRSGMRHMEVILMLRGRHLRIDGIDLLDLVERAKVVDNRRRTEG